ncbi:MAG: vitamin K epoxide reductase family protein [Anaerolineaceae bacterium]|nr:vitamin K epoxide reductase family protein [Anaerolineaceae bacterium]
MKTKNKIINVALLLSILGLIDAIYLALIKFLNKPEMCLEGVGDCWSVNLSPYSSIYGIPVSVLGALAYITIIFLLLIEQKRPEFKDIIIKLTFGITTIGFLFSLYLTYLELYVIHAICPFCVVSAILMTILFIVYIIRIKEVL